MSSLRVGLGISFAIWVCSFSDLTVIKIAVVAEIRIPKLILFITEFRRCNGRIGTLGLKLADVNSS